MKWIKFLRFAAHMIFFLVLGFKRNSIPSPLFWGGGRCCTHLQHVEIPRLGVKLELQLPTTATATAMQGSELCLIPTPQLTETPDP